jgi:proline iminopeptidase
VLGLVTTTSKGEVKWITEDLRAVFPEQWHRLARVVPESLRSLPIIDAYARMTNGPDALAAAQAWCAWEDAHVSLMPGHEPSPLYANPEFALRFARMVTHYWSQAAAFGHDDILPRAAELTGIPGVMIHGRYDISSKMEVPWELSRRWTTSELRVMGDGGHGGESFVSMSVDAIEEVTSRIGAQ